MGMICMYAFGNVSMWIAKLHDFLGNHDVMFLRVQCLYCRLFHCDPVTPYGVIKMPRMANIGLGNDLSFRRHAIIILFRVSMCGVIWVLITILIKNLQPRLRLWLSNLIRRIKYVFNRYIFVSCVLAGWIQGINYKACGGLTSLLFW